MTSARRSLVRSAFQNIRRLWQRREQGRRDMRRAIGNHFEALEPRLALTISAPLPSPTDHIHPVLSIFLDGQQVVLPVGIGLTSTNNYNPHTHDFTGTLHIGEGGPAGTGTTARNVTLADFFDVWRTVDGQESGKNTSAIFDTDTTDGTPLPRIMDKVVDSTHVLRVYVKESADVAAELEYDSSSSSNNLARPELYVPRDGDQIFVVYEKNTQTVGSPSFQPIANQTVLGGAPSWLGLDGFDPTGGPLTYSVSSSNPGLLAATITPTTNKTLVLNVEDYGQMRFQLFNDLSPRTTQHIETLVNNGQFATLAKFYRISRTDETQLITRNANGSTTFSFGGVSATPLNLSTTTTVAEVQAALNSIPALAGNARVSSQNANGPFTVTFSGQLAGTDVPQLTVNNANATVTTIATFNDFVIQGGPANPNSTLGRFDDEYHVDLQFTTPGLLAMAKSNDDTNDSQVFVTGGPARFLDMQHSIFGVLTEGDAVRRAIQHTGNSGDGAPPSDIVITSAQIITDNQNGALKLKAAEGASGQANVTVTVTDAQNKTFSQTFQVTVTPDTANSAPFLNPIAPITGSVNQPITVQLTAQDVENNPSYFDATPASGANFSLTVNHDTGLVTITPTTGFAGTFNVTMGVRGVTSTTTADQFDTQLVTVTVAGTAPTGVDLEAASDSGASNSDNITNATSLNFTVSGVTSGATVKLLKGTTVLAQGVATGTSISLAVANPGTALGQGASAITATQTVSGQESAASPALSVTYDNAAPTFSSTAPTTALTGFNLDYNAQTNEEGTTGLVYSLAASPTPPTGATINSSTGVVSWTPSSTQTGAQAFTIVATDAAGNTANQAVNLTVAAAKVDLTLTITTTAGAALSSVAPGQDFVLHFFAQDVRSSATGDRGVFAAFADITFDGAKATVTGPIQYSSTFGNGRSGNTTTAGTIDEAGAFGGTTPTGTGKLEVLSIPMRAAATATGSLTFSMNPADTTPANNVLVFGQNGAVPAAEIHYGSATVEIGSTFNAVNDTFSATEDTSNNVIDPLANDASIGGATNTLTITAVGTTNRGGTVTITQNGTRLSYTPAANVSGAETFTYTAKNQNGEEHTATVTMNVTNVNDAPTAVNDSLSATRNSTSNTLNVLANDTDPDTGDTLRVTAVGTGSQGGTITIGANGANILYTPATGFTGNETFTYTISDRATGGLTATATVTVNVSGLTATNDSGANFTVNEDSSATTLDVLANDALDPQFGGTLTITAAGTSGKGDQDGTVAITQNGTRISYTPAANFQGTEKFTYTISDGQGHTATATVTMTVNNVNDPPTAANDTLTAFLNTATTFDVLANDSSLPDPAENLVIDAASITQPAHGTVSVSADGKTVNYTPTTGYSGPDSFTYKARDPGGALSAAATANVNVQAFQPSSLGGLVYFDVNNNGTKDAGELAIAGVTITLTGTPTGESAITPIVVKTGDDGSYSFTNLKPGTYTITQTQPQFVIDGKDTVGSQGGEISTSPGATVPKNAIRITTLAQGTTGTGNNFSELGRTAAAITNRDFYSSNARNYAIAAFDSSGAELWHTVSGSMGQGMTNVSFSLLDSNSQLRVQSTNGSAPVTRTYSTTDSSLVFLAAQSGGNLLYRMKPNAFTGTAANQVPTAVADSYSTAAGTTLTVTAANGVLKNDTDPENTTLTASITTQPTRGTVTLNSDGSFTYTPNAGVSGTDTFAYKASDGTNQSAAATVTITVGTTPTNTAPTAVADAYSTPTNTALTVTAANGVLKNDTDPESNTLTASIVSQPTRGTVTFNANGSFTFTPSSGFTGTDTFTYKANDGTSDSNTATVTINIGTNTAPTGVADSYSTSEDTALTVTAANGVLKNDTDLEGNTLTAVSLTQPAAGGTVSLGADGAFTFTPTANFNGTTSFTYKASDGTLQSAVTTVTITVSGTNDPPVAVNDSFPATKNTTLTIAAPGVLVNDSDTDTNSSALTVTVVSTTTHGTLTLNPNGSFTYTPNTGYIGPDAFSYRVSDGSLTADAIANITVNDPQNQPPAAVNDSYNATEDTPLVVTTANRVLANDTDANSNPLTASVVTQPTSGTLSFAADGTFTYTPQANFSGTDSFTYKANDGLADSNTATVTITVAAVNDAPVGAADTYQADPSTPLIVNAAQGVLANDTDPENGTLTAAVAVPPANGTLTLASNGSFTYTPNAGFQGTDTFTYRASDGSLQSGATTVSIAVNNVPVAANDSYSTNEDTPLSVPTPGVLANDTDADSGTTLTATVTTQPLHGTVSLAANGSFVYTPAANYNGPDSFRYQASDGTNASTPATVNITVNAVNDAPVAAADNYTTNVGTALVRTAIQGVLANDSDVEGSQLTVSLASVPAHGTVTLNSDGSFTYTPTAGYQGSDSFTYNLSDGVAQSSPGTVNIIVNAAPVAVNDSYTATEDTLLTVNTAQGVLINDTDAESNPLTAVVVSQPQHGTLTLNANGSFTYTPAANFSGTDGFSYKANDGSADSAVAAVTLTVTAVNDAPVGVSDSYTATQDTQLVVAAATGLLSNDTDADAGDTLTVVAASVTQPSHGTVTVAADGSFTYTPTAGYTGADSFTYKASDGTAESATTTVNITVNDHNHAPVATNDSYDAVEDTPLTIPLAQRVLLNDTDEDGNPLTAIRVGNPQNGSLTFNSDGSFVYTPSVNFHGTDSFTYKANDGLADSNLATVTITVAPLNDIPNAVFDSYAVAQDATLNVPFAQRVLLNDSDVDGDPLTAIVVDQPQHGSLTLNANGTFTYTPQTGFSGNDSFTYKANDGTADSAPATVAIKVAAPPQVQADSFTMDEDAVLIRDAASGVLANDTDPESDPFFAELLAQPQNGTLTLGADGSFTYTPAANFHGTDSFTYRATDNVATSGVATVTITVNPVNDAPQAVNDSYVGDQDTPLVIPFASRVLLNDSDVDGDSLTAELVGQPTSGTVTLNSDGSFTYTPNSGFTGQDTFTYNAKDGVTSTLATVTITVQPSGGEGESSSAAIDGALLSYLGGQSSGDPSDWQAAVDEAMSQLG